MMAEYIKRETLINHLDACMDTIWKPEIVALKCFVEGIPAADVAPVRHGKWISVKDRLPEPTYCVLVVGAYGEMEIDALGTDGEWMGMVEDVTHWMPLPEPPKGDADNG